MLSERGRERIEQGAAGIGAEETDGRWPSVPKPTRMEQMLGMRMATLNGTGAHMHPHMPAIMAQVADEAEHPKAEIVSLTTEIRSDGENACLYLRRSDACLRAHRPVQALNDANEAVRKHY